MYICIACTVFLHPAHDRSWLKLARCGRAGLIIACVSHAVLGDTTVCPRGASCLGNPAPAQPMAHRCPGAYVARPNTPARIQLGRAPSRSRHRMPIEARMGREPHVVVVLQRFVDASVSACALPYAALPARRVVYVGAVPLSAPKKVGGGPPDGFFGSKRGGGRGSCTAYCCMVSGARRWGGGRGKGVPARGTWMTR